MKQEYRPLSKDQLSAIKAGDVIERMLGFEIPVYLVVQKVEGGIIDAGWKFSVETGIEVDEDIPTPVSYIQRVLTEDQKDLLKNGAKKIPY